MAVEFRKDIGAGVIRDKLREVVEKTRRSVMKRTSEWIVFPAPGGAVHIYLRVNTSGRATLTIANITAEHPGHGDGTFVREHIEMFARRNSYQALFIENVNNGRYQAHLLTKGYIIKSHTGVALEDGSILGATVIKDVQDD